MTECEEKHLAGPRRRPTLLRRVFGFEVEAILAGSVIALVFGGAVFAFFTPTGQGIRGRAVEYALKYGSGILAAGGLLVLILAAGCWIYDMARGLLSRASGSSRQTLNARQDGRSTAKAGAEQSSPRADEEPHLWDG